MDEQRPKTDIAEKRPEAIEDEPGRVVAAMRKLRARIKPDPGGWTTRDYVNYGRNRAGTDIS